MKRGIMTAAALTMAFLCAVLSGCGKPANEPENEPHYLFATVIEAGLSPLVEPVEGSWELASADRIYVGTPDMTDEASQYTLSALRAGDTVRIAYDGMIAETYPAQINGASEILFSDANNYDVTYKWMTADVVGSEYSRPAVTFSRDDELFLLQSDYSSDPEVEKILDELKPGDRVAVCWCTVFDMSPPVIDVFRALRVPPQSVGEQ